MSRVTSVEKPDDLRADSSVESGSSPTRSETKTAIPRFLKGGAFDVIAVVILFFLAIEGAIAFLDNCPIKTDPGPTQAYATAVMYACGRGLRSPAAQPPVLAAFLQMQSQTFDCSSLPARIEYFDRMPTTETAYRYLLTFTGIMWKYTGVSWFDFRYFTTVLFGLTIALVYCVFRLGMRPPLAILCSLIFATSLVHLSNLPRLRDYAKAPFIIAFALILGIMVKYPLQRWLVALLSALAGVILGIGIGFRPDMAIALPMFVLTTVVFLPGKVLGNLITKVIALVSFAACFYVAARPILSHHVSGAGNFMTVSFGIMSPLDPALGVTVPAYRTRYFSSVASSQSPHPDSATDTALYERGYLYWDNWLHTIFQGYSVRTGSRETTAYIGSKAFETASRGFFTDVVKTFPADYLIRAYSSILKILELPYTELPPRVVALNYYGAYTGPEHLGITDPGLLGFYAWRKRLCGLMTGAGLLVTAVAILMVSSRNIRLAAFMLVFLCYFAGYPLLYFHFRHYFHLEFLSLWALGFVLQQIVLFVRSELRKTRSRPVEAGA